MKRAVALGLVAVVFAVGLAAGVLGARLIHAPSTPSGPRSGPPPFQRYFAHGDLDLTEEQRLQIDEILHRQRGKFEEVHRDLKPRVEALMDETQESIEAILTPDQVERYRSKRDRWNRRERRHGPRRDGNRRHLRDRHAVPPPADAESDGSQDG